MPRIIIYLEEDKSKIGIYEDNNQEYFETLTLGLNSNPLEYAKEIKKLLFNFKKDATNYPFYLILKPNIAKALMIKMPKVKDYQEEIELAEKQVLSHLHNLDVDLVQVFQYKLAPFIYQFVCIEKDILEWINKTNLELKQKIKGVFPFELLLPKLTDDLLSAFELKYNDSYLVVVTELTGTIFVKTFHHKPTNKDVVSLLEENSLYNIVGHEPIIYPLYGNDEKVYSLLNNGTELKNANEENLELLISNRVLSKNEGIIKSNANLLSIINPKNKASIKAKQTAGVKSNPTKNKKRKAIVLSIVIISGILIQLIVGFDNIFKAFNNNKGRQKESDVLSDNQTYNIQTKENENSQQDQNQTTPKEEKNEQKEQKTPLEKSKIKIRVENGNGIAGSAAKMKFYLENFGYTVSEIGNADKSNYPKTLILLPEEFKNYEGLITEDLKEKYQIQVEIVKQKPQTYDILIIVGQN